MGYRLALASCCVLVLLLVSGAEAFPTAGIAVPLPEVLPEDTFELQLCHQGSQMLQATEARDLIGFQAGVGWDTEVGVDVRLGEARDDWPSAAYRLLDLRYDAAAEGFESVWFNAKKRMVTETGRRPEVALGLLNLGADGNIAPYGVVGKRYRGWQLCVGGAHAYGNSRWFESLSYDYNPQWRFMVEHISTGRFSTNVGVRMVANDRWTIIGGGMFANNDWHDNSGFLRVAYRGNW